jgi:YVTN family beta-propeller protein
LRGAGALLCALALAGCDQTPAIPALVYSLAEHEYWPDLTGYPGVASGRILLTNNLDDTVSALDLATLEEVARVPVGLNPVEREGPHHLAVDPSGEHYYVGISNFVPGAGSGPHGTHGAGRADGYVLKIRARDNVEVASVRVDRSPGDVRMTPDGRFVLATHFDLLRISEVLGRGGAQNEMDTRFAIVDAATMTRVAMVPICAAAHGMAVTADARTAYVSCYADAIAIVDLADPSHPVRRVPVLSAPGPVTSPRCQPYAVTLSPSEDSVWVSCLTSGQVLCYDVGAGTMDPARSVALPGPALFGAFTADGGTLIVPYQGAGGLAFVDPETGATELAAFEREDCTNPHAVRFAEGGRLLVVCEGDHVAPGTLVSVDAQARAVERVVTVGRFPDDVQVLREVP